jgi:hypothetical protein
VWARVGASPLDGGVFAATVGLLGFAATLCGVAWLLLAAVQYEAPLVSGWKHAMLAVRVLLGSTAFFTFVAIVYFGVAENKDNFCLAFEPEGQGWVGTCGFGDGFNVGIAALVFSVLTTVVSAAWMRADLGSRYEFSSAGGGGKAGYDQVGMGGGSHSGEGAAPIVGNAYQGIGATDL